ncbi:MAG TPA: laminin B domain-containing protein [Verrucomicrobiota bacterium]|nr:laminin B domain-containing protein [Verrucomicrobiota bacterium]
MYLPTFSSLAALTLIAAGSTQGAESRFDLGPEDWRIADLRTGGPYVTPLRYYDVTWLDADGDPGGCLSVHDPSNNSFAFDAPAKFLGDWSAFAGARLGFSLRSSHQNWTDDSAVMVVGVINGSPRAIVSPIVPQPGTQWSFYTIELAAGQFRYDNRNGAFVTAQDFQQVITNVTALRINGEYGAAVQETVGLDSVSLPARPVLAIESAGDQVVLSWADWAAAFQLQVNGALQTLDWMDVTNTPTAGDGRLRVTRDIANPPAWYRLRWP